MFTYQENTHFSQAVRCGREKLSTAWKIDSRRDILDVVERHDAEGIKRWLKNEDYGKFLAKKRGLKKLSARQKFFEKNDEERLLAFAQELKDNLTAFIFSCYEFDATPTANGKPFCHRRLADCHLNGLVMLDIDHVENPLEVFEALKAGIRIVFTANIKDGNLADNQIVFAQALGYKADQSCIDATRNSFAPKEEDILYINEDLLFNYYDEEFDKRFTPEYRQKKTQPLYHEFASSSEKNNFGTDFTDLHELSCKTMDEDAKRNSCNPCNPCQEIKWRGYDVQSIIDARYADKLPCAADGDKAAVLRIVEAQPWVKEIIDERDEKVSQTVASAADCVAQKEKKYASSLPSKAMLEAIQKVTGKSYQEITKAQAQRAVVVGDDDINRWLWDWGAQIEELSKDFPLLKDICKGLKKNQYPAAVFVAGGLMMTLMTRCTYRFYHRPEELRRLNNSTLIIGDPASGKSFATRLFKLLAAPMVARVRTRRSPRSPRHFSGCIRLVLRMPNSFRTW